MQPRRQPSSDSSSREPDRNLVRINVLAFAAARGLDEEHAIAAFLHADLVRQMFCVLGWFPLKLRVLACFRAWWLVLKSAVA
jgi:hypothetical protein